MKKKLRCLVPVFCFLALIALFSKLPAMAYVLKTVQCHACIANPPYVPLLGSGYFALLMALFFLFPRFPGRLLADAGLVWALLLTGALAFLQYPVWCTPCLIANSCHILIWFFWKVAPPSDVIKEKEFFNVRIYLCFISPLVVIALFSSLNLTLVVYSEKKSKTFSEEKHIGFSSLPTFMMETTQGKTITHEEGNLIINFISPECSYCKEQLPIFNEVAAAFPGDSYRFINISPIVYPELIEVAPNCEWVDDKEGSLRQLFQVTGYPTLFIINADRKLVEVIPGVPDNFNFLLKNALTKRD